MRAALVLGICVLALVSSGHSASPIEQDEIDLAIRELREGGDVKRGDLVRNLIELKCRHADQDTKLQSLESLIKLGAAVLSTRDRSIDTDARLGIWPAFDAQAHGSKYPIFAGTNPDAITEPNVREAYRKALSTHQETLVRFNEEKRKTEIATESLLAAKRLMEQMNSQQAMTRVKQALASLADDHWISEFARRTIFSPAPIEPNSGKSGLGPMNRISILENANYRLRRHMLTAMLTAGCIAGLWRVTGPGQQASDPAIDAHPQGRATYEFGVALERTIRGRIGKPGTAVKTILGGYPTQSSVAVEVPNLPLGEHGTVMFIVRVCESENEAEKHFDSGYMSSKVVVPKNQRGWDRLALSHIGLVGRSERIAIAIYFNPCDPPGYGWAAGFADFVLSALDECRGRPINKAVRTIEPQSVGPLGQFGDGMVWFATEPASPAAISSQPSSATDRKPQNTASAAVSSTQSDSSATEAPRSRWLWMVLAAAIMCVIAFVIWSAKSHGSA